MEFKLRAIPGGVSGILELIAKYHFNISYLSSQTDGSGWQMFKMGLFVEKPEQFSHFLHAASRLCPVRVLDYDKGEKILDNSIFYISFASELAEQMGLGQESRTDLIINANLIMQMLDERNKPFIRPLIISVVLRKPWLPIGAPHFLPGSLSIPWEMTSILP